MEARVFLVAVCVVIGLGSLDVWQRSGTALSEKTPSIFLLRLSDQMLTSRYSGLLFETVGKATIILLEKSNHALL